ncbi:MAG: hypothetical protein JJE22_06835 [Bacteroidia bacterium]|nr:hypothetical protein [Bacteroidia bacterium]
MNLRVFFYLLLFFFFVVVKAKSQYQGFGKSAFYNVIKSGNSEEMDAQINIVKESLIPEKEAYEGTLLMKRSERLTKAKDKMIMFKSGRSKLESSISKDRDNTEYRFLRLIIQEHAPKIVKYRNDMEEDSKLIHTNFKSLSSFLQQQIIDYSKKSKVLKTP